MSVTPHPYASAVYDAQQAISELAREAAALESPGLPAAELLELLRLTLHRQLDDLIDEEALRHPSPGRIIVRTARYIELYHGQVSA